MKVPTEMLGAGHQPLRITNRLTALLLGLLLAVLLLLRHSFLVADMSFGMTGSANLATLPPAGALATLSGPRSSACKVSTRYLPSDLEQTWMKHAAAWGADVCTHMTEVENSTRVWLDTLAQHTQLQGKPTEGQSPAEVLAKQHKMDARVFSRFTTTYDCGLGKTTERITWIEPLSHGLRHPNALCNRGADLMDRKYLLLAHQADHAAARQLGNVQCANRTCQAIYFDLGATTLQPTPQEAGQGWFFSAYKRQGITFDRFLLWEMEKHDPEDIFRHVPRADIHKYQYYNVPVTPDTADPSNPVNILKAIAQPGDFVVFKMDIDHYDIEHALMKMLRSDPRALALIDEFYFEDHVNFAPMMPYWAPRVGKGTSLASSYALFAELRQHGVRAHSWV